MDDETRHRVVTAISAVATLAWLVGFAGVGVSFYALVSNVGLPAPVAVALVGVSLGATLSMVENRLLGRGWYAEGEEGT
jgi:xanthosine utilization system XapX-like protein